MGLGNSEAHRQFVMLSTQKRKSIKARSSKLRLLKRTSTQPV